MLDIFADNIFLTLFLVIALGAILGAVPFGPVKFGAAGALFVGLIIGAVIPEPDADLRMLQDLGLGLFVYLVGLEAGETFFKEIRKQFGMMLTAIAAVGIGAAAAVIAGELLNVPREFAVGVFAGALTNTPSLALAQAQTGSTLPAVGYSLGYPTGVVMAILLIALFIGRNWKARRDRANPDDAVLEVARVEVSKPMSAKDFIALGGNQARISTVRRNHHTLVIGHDDQLQLGDVLTVFATKSALPGLIGALGKRVPRRPFRDQEVGLHRFLLSNRDIAGNSVGELPLFDHHQSRITRIRRADREFLATPGTYLEMGDIVEVVHPVKRIEELAGYFGDSIRTVSEVDLVAAAGGLALGYAAALVVVPLPGGSAFALGSAAGPLIMGLVLGALRRTARVSWRLPRSANVTLRQFGLMLFLAAAGIASGPAFASTAFTRDGLNAVLIAALVVVAACGSLFFMIKLLGQSATRASGGVSGLLGQPAILQFALSRSADSRIMTGYGTTVTVSVLFKIIVVPLMLAV